MTFIFKFSNSDPDLLSSKRTHFNYNKLFTHLVKIFHFLKSVRFEGDIFGFVLIYFNFIKKINYNEKLKLIFIRKLIFFFKDLYFF